MSPATTLIVLCIALTAVLDVRKEIFRRLPSQSHLECVPSGGDVVLPCHHYLGSRDFMT